MNADIRNETFLHEEIERERFLGLERDACAQTERATKLCDEMLAMVPHDLHNKFAENVSQPALQFNCRARRATEVVVARSVFLGSGVVLDPSTCTAPSGSSRIFSGRRFA